MFKRINGTIKDFKEIITNNKYYNSIYLKKGYIILYRNDTRFYLYKEINNIKYQYMFYVSDLIKSGIITLVSDPYIWELTYKLNINKLA